MTHTLRVGGSGLPTFLGQPALEPVRLSGREGVNSLFQYELWLKTPDALNMSATAAANFNLDDFIGREISCSIELDGNGMFVAGAIGAGTDRIGAGTREINALVTAAQFWGEEGRQVQYKLTLHPWLHLATLSTDCKVFQNQTVVEILDALLADYAFAVEKRLYERYPQRDYQVQYNESDFAFFERLCQEWGISYHFEHAEGKHRLVLSDAMAAFRPNASAAYQQVEYHPPGWKIDAEYIHAFAPEHHLTSGRYSTTDYDYTQPRADLSASRSDPRPTGHADSEVYQWHGDQGGSHYAQPRAGSPAASQAQADRFAGARDEAGLLTLLRMQQLRSAGARARAGGNLRGMQPGHTFRLTQHPRESANSEYLILDAELLIEDIGQDSQIKGAAATGRAQQWRVQVDFTSHPVGEQLRPALTRIKPHTHGPQTALVVGPGAADSATGVSENIWTDELGRIKIQFPWDRIGGNNQHSSCWIRVASPWAGNQLGAIHLPRIGQEVIIDFVGADPDLPVCTGRVANQVNLPPWKLPEQSALSGIRSRELNEGGGNSAAGRSNHLVLDDTAGQIQAQLKSDHQHSSLSLGHITRIEDNEGRKDQRGDGFELRTDGHGVARAGEGLLISTEGRDNARGHVKDMSEAVTRMTQARDQHETLAELAEHHHAQEPDEDQSAVSKSLKAQNDAIRGAGNADAQAGRFPELTQPHMVLSSAAGIEATASGNVAIDAREHIAITSGQHTSVVSTKSILASALEAVRLFAYERGIRIFAAKGPVQVQAQDDQIELTAQKAIELASANDYIYLSAREGISLTSHGSTFVIDGKGFSFYTPGQHKVWAGEHQTFERAKGSDQPFAMPLTGPAPEQGLRQEQFVLYEHRSGLRLPQQKYRITMADGRQIAGTTNDRGETQVVQSVAPEIAMVDILRHAEDGIVARHAPWVTTPAEPAQRPNPVAAKDTKGHAIGQRRHARNEAGPTEEVAKAQNASCEPHNWGMRRHEPAKDDPGKVDYPVARAYVQRVKEAIKTVDWGAVTWPLGKRHDQLTELMRELAFSALRQGAFALPRGAEPRFLIAKESQVLELGKDPENPDLQGFAALAHWTLAINKSPFVAIQRQAPNISGSPKGTPLLSVIDVELMSLFSTIFHEARHIQQYFWMSALLQQSKQNYRHLPHIDFYMGFLPAKTTSVAAQTPIPDEPTAKVGLHQMIIAQHYQNVLQAEIKYNTQKKAGNLTPQELAMTERSLQLVREAKPAARKEAYELLQNTQAGRNAIDVDEMASDTGSGRGYRMRPWEEDSFACDKIIESIWRGHLTLPEPGTCTDVLRIITSGLPENSRTGGQHVN